MAPLQKIIDVGDKDRFAMRTVLEKSHGRLFMLSHQYFVVGRTFGNDEIDELCDGLPQGIRDTRDFLATAPPLITDPSLRKPVDIAARHYHLTMCRLNITDEELASCRLCWQWVLAPDGTTAFDGCGWLIAHVDRDGELMVIGTGLRRPWMNTRVTAKLIRRKDVKVFRGRQVILDVMSQWIEAADDFVKHDR